MLTFVNLACSWNLCRIWWFWNLRSLYYVDYRESCNSLCRLSWFWNHRAPYYVDYRDSGIFVHLMSTIVILEISCSLLCWLLWICHVSAIYYVDYREFGMLFVHFIKHQLYLANRWGYVANEYTGWQDQGRMGIQRLGKPRPLLTRTQT